MACSDPTRPLVVCNECILKPAPRSAAALPNVMTMPNGLMPQSNSGAEPTWRTVAEFTVPVKADLAAQTVQPVIDAMMEFQLSPAQVQSLTQAMAEELNHAALHNSRLRLELPVQIKISVSIPVDRVGACCWGFFVIARTADRSSAPDGPAHHTIELFLYQEIAPSPL